MSNDVKEVLQFLEKVKSDLSKFQKAPSSKDKGKKKIEEDLKNKVIEADKREPPKNKTAIRPTKDTVIDIGEWAPTGARMTQTRDKTTDAVNSASIGGVQVWQKK